MSDSFGQSGKTPSDLQSSESTVTPGESAAAVDFSGNIKLNVGDAIRYMQNSSEDWDSATVLSRAGNGQK